jgi:hypothetical protein
VPQSTERSDACDVAPGSATEEGGLQSGAQRNEAVLDRKPGRRPVTVLPPIMRPASGERAERVIGAPALLLVQMDGDAAYEHGDQNLPRCARAEPMGDHSGLGSRRLIDPRLSWRSRRLGFWTLRDSRSGFGLDIDLVDGRSNANVEPAEESFLAKEVERERPGVTEPHRRLPGHLT